jgi:hypothetical protein
LPTPDCKLSSKRIQEGQPNLFFRQFAPASGFGEARTARCFCNYTKRLSQHGVELAVLSGRAKKFEIRQRAGLSRLLFSAGVPLTPRFKLKMAFGACVSRRGGTVTMETAWAKAAVSFAISRRPASGTS